jgi:hypothetical protein
MGRKSKIESHPNSKIIITRLASGEEYSKIVEDFPELTCLQFSLHAYNSAYNFQKTPEKSEIWKFLEEFGSLEKAFAPPIGEHALQAGFQVIEMIT